MEWFSINKNVFLKVNTSGYYHQDYLKYHMAGNPDFLNVLKNTFNNIALVDLVRARDTVKTILISDLKEVVELESLNNAICVCVPRAKALTSYHATQMYFKEAVALAVGQLPGIIDGTDCIQRTVNTETTHLSKTSIPNDGARPYPGITEKTCRIDRKRINGSDILLIDDIYTKTINIDEDCIQALLNSGARRVVFFAIARTRH